MAVEIRLLASQGLYCTSYSNGKAPPSLVSDPAMKAMD
jgi:hypothetical protein